MHTAFLGLPASSPKLPFAPTRATPDLGGKSLAIDSEGYFYTVLSKKMRIHNPQFFPKPVNCTVTVTATRPNSINCVEVFVDQPGKDKQSIKFIVRTGNPSPGASCDGMFLLYCIFIVHR